MMGKGKHLQELSNQGFFISPCGHFIPVKGSHIATVVERPAAFGLTREEIDTVFAVHGETRYIEGKARHELLSRILADGWIRLRRGNNRWSVQSDRLDADTMALVQAWARQILRGMGGSIERDRYIDVDLEGLSDSKRQRTSVGDLARGSGKRATEKLVCCAIEEYDATSRDAAG